MHFIIVKAKVLRIEEDQIGQNYKEFENPEKNYVWGPRSIKVEDIETTWGQSVNRSIIGLYSGETVLVAEPHKELHDRIESILAERERIGLSNETSQEEEEDFEEEDAEGTSED